jgi:enediyne biosynthesis protein E4
VKQQNNKSEMTMVKMRWICCLLIFGGFTGFLFSAVSKRSLTLGSVTFENITAPFGLARISATFGCVCYDADRDGFPDLIISNHGDPPTVFSNQRGKIFREIALLPKDHADRHAPVMADFDNDGDEDLYILKGAHQGQGLGPNEFYVNAGDHKPFALTEAGISDPKGRGRGAVWFDFDQDGYLDLLVINQLRRDAPNRFFHNNGNGTFTDISEASKMDLVMDTDGGAVAGDIDNDGDMDAVVSSLGYRHGIYLLINNGHGKFQNRAVGWHVPFMDKIWAVGMDDYNNDGYLDLYLSSGGNFALDGAFISGNKLRFAQNVTPHSDPEDSLTFLTPGDAVLTFDFPRPNRELLENIFVGAKAVKPVSVHFEAGSRGLDPTGEPDQKTAARAGTYIWRENKTRRWHIVTKAGSEELNSAAEITSTAPISDLQTKEMEISNLSLPNVLLENRKNGSFADVSETTHTGDPANSRSAVWTDFDNDGNKDLFVVNAGFIASGKQPNRLYLNENGVFKKYDVPMDADERMGRGDAAVAADFNQDGLLDLFIVNGLGSIPGNRGPYQLLLNTTHNSNHWVAFRLIGAGKNYTNRDAIGAKVKLTASGGKQQWEYVLGGSGSACQDATHVLHFGLGSATQGDVIIYWPPGVKYPKGHQQSLHIGTSEIDRTHEVNEER